MAEASISPLFQDSLLANLAFWQARVEVPVSQFATLDSEAENLAQAVRYGLELPRAWEPAVQLALTLMEYVEGRGLWRGWLPLLERARGLIAASHPLWGRLTCRVGFLYRLDGQVPLALERHQEARAFAKAIGDEREAGLAALGMADEYYLLHRYAEAEAAAQAGRETLLTHGETGPRRAADNLLGMLAHARGAYPEASRHYEAALAQWPPAQAPQKHAQTLTNYANTLRELNRLAEAHAALSQAVVLLEACGSRLPLAFTQLALGTVFFSEGDYPAALATFRAIDLVFLRRYGYLAPQASVMNNLGHVHLALKQYRAAEEYLSFAVEGWRTLEEPVNLANTLGDLGEACFHQGLADQARLHWDEAHALLTRHLTHQPEDAWAQRLARGITTRLAWIERPIGN